MVQKSLGQCTRTRFKPVKPRRQLTPDVLQSKPGRSLSEIHATTLCPHAEIAWNAPQIFTIIRLALKLAMSPDHLAPENGVAGPVDKLLAFVRDVCCR